MALQLIALLLLLVALCAPRALLREHLKALYAAPVISLVIGIGGLLLQMIFAPKPKDQYGARLSDVNVAAVSPGNPVVELWGTMKIPCQVIWVSKIMETAHTQSQSSGGKGGGGGATSTTYTYSVHCAVAMCAGPVYRIHAILANQKILWYDPNVAADLQAAFDAAYVAEATRLFDLGVDADNAYVGGFFFAFNNFQVDNEADLSTQSKALAYITGHPVNGMPAPNSGNVNALLGQMLSGLSADNDYPPYKQRYSTISVYRGTGDQVPNSLMESFKGVGNVPAYRGVAYFVVNNLQLEDFGNTIPSFQAVIEKDDGTVYLSDIIADVCVRSGLDTTEVDTKSGIGSVDDPEVHGFAVTQVTAGRSVIQDLMKVYPFDACESGFRLKFDWINRRAHTIIRREDLGAHIQGETLPASEESTRIADFDLPKMVKLNFQEPARNYSKNVAYAARQVLTQSNQVDEVDVTIAMDREQAKKWVEQLLVNRYMARRTNKWKLPKKYVVVEPGDCVLIPDLFDDPGHYNEHRVMETNVGANQIVEMSVIDHHFAFPITATTQDDIPGTENDGAEQELLKSGRTRAYMLDLPLLSDTENDSIGYYCVLAQSRPSWGGGFLLVDINAGGAVTAFGTSSDPAVSGSDWQTVTFNDRRVVHGHVLNTLGSGHSAVFDYGNHIDVFLIDTSMIFDQATEGDVLQGQTNMLVVGDEVLQFTTAQDNGNGNWRLSGLLRGLRGTEWAMSTHVAGERLIRLATLSVKRVTHDQKYLQIAGTYKALTVQEATDDEAPFNFTNTGVSLKPYAPDVRHAHRDETGQLIIDWQPRNRQNGSWLSGQDVVLDQTFETYEIDVYNATGTAVIKTYSLSDVRTWTYTAAAQTGDLGGPPTNLKIAIYQIGNIIGRGFGTTITVTK